jgi:branched-chain amino acid transport system ATP-binding protein
MALEVASYAYVLELGVVSLSGTVEELRRTDEVQRLYLGGEATARAATAGTAQRRTLTRWQD